MLKKNVLLAVALSARVAAAPMSALAKKENSGVGPGMNEAGEDVNSAQVESGSGAEVVGINDYEGEITGIPAPDNKFTVRQIGMTMQQITDLRGEPHHKGTHMTIQASTTIVFRPTQERDLVATTS